MRDGNLILGTDSYKLTHWEQYPPGTTGVYSYLESRRGAEFPYTVFFGLQAILRKLEGRVVTLEDLEEAEELSRTHFANAAMNSAGWRYILQRGGRLPLRIKAVPEGTRVPTGNVMMTVENTDPHCFWLTNAMESLLVHVWYPCTVATLSRATKEMLRDKLARAGASAEGLDFMLHDFGYRGASSDESAAIGGAAHLVNFRGTDTLLGMLLARDVYDADPGSLAFSVPATEHSVMTAEGRDGELGILDRLLDVYPSGILSVVADSYDVYRFVARVCALRDRVVARDGGVLVVRPDSVTSKHPTPGLLVVDILESLWAAYGGTETAKGYRVLDDHVRVLWGDGINYHGIEKIVDRAMVAGFSPENLVFGMGGGLLQRVNRDTQRFAFKAAAIRGGGRDWVPVAKAPLDVSKTSKAGRMKLVFSPQDGWLTLAETMPGRDRLELVFEDGEVVRHQSFEEVRALAEGRVAAHA